MYRRIILLVLLLIYMFALLVSCSEAGGSGGESDGSSSAGDKESINFSDITYSRPDVDLLCNRLLEVRREVKDNVLSASQLRESVGSANILYSNYLSMLAYAELMHAKNENDELYTGEFKYLSAERARVCEAAEGLALEISLSDKKSELISAGQGLGISLKLDDDISVTSEVISLLKQEEKLKSDFALLSPDTVEITIGGTTDTYNATIKRLAEAFGSATIQFAQSKEICDALYNQSLTARKCEIFVELARVRSLIATSLGYKDYNEYSYELLGLGYTKDQYVSFTESVFEYLLPVYSDLSHKIFNPYFNNHIPKLLDKSTILSNTLELYKTLDNQLFTAFGNMISYELYDISAPKPGRTGDSYTAYFHNKSVPYLFHTSFGDARDYSAISYAFGGYYEILKNGYNVLPAPDAELSARMLEMMTVSTLTGALDQQNGKYLYYLTMREVMSTLVLDSFAALVEHEIYEMDYSDITVSSVSELVHALANEYAFHSFNFKKFMCDELITNPHFKQQKALATFYVNEVYFSDIGKDKTVELYTLITRAEDGRTAAEVISSFGIASPFNEDAIKKLSDDIFYSINGYHYYKNDADDENAA